MPKKKPEVDKDLNSILICAVRYCIGRQTYMPGLVQEWIMHHADLLTPQTVEIMIRDIDEADRIHHYEKFDIDGLGDTRIDRPGWERFRAWLKTRTGENEKV